MNKKTIAILSLAALGVGFLATYTGLLSPVIAWVSMNVMPHINNFFGWLKATPIASGILASASGGGAIAVAKSVYTSQGNAKVQAVKTTSETQINNLQNQLFQTGKVQTSSEQTIAALQQQITELKAAKPDSNEQLMEAQQLVVQYKADNERLRSDINSLTRLMAEIKSVTKVVIG